MAEGLGSRLRDVDGHAYIDYLLGLGPMILGHRHPAVTQAVASAVSELGTCFGLPYELEIEAARKVTEAVPGVEMVRFSNSGSEVVGTAVRLARAHTGRRLIIRFEGTTMAGRTPSTGATTWPRSWPARLTCPGRSRPVLVSRLSLKPPSSC
jgi:glutamate-1-semialdehyde 2,1-aminomutase